MVDLASTKLGHDATVSCGDMRDMADIKPRSAAAVISLFALHHLDADGADRAIREWRRILRVGGQLLIGTWEGSGLIDYGGSTDIAARRYTGPELRSIVQQAGFIVNRCAVEPVGEMAMDAVYLEATRAT